MSETPRPVRVDEATARVVFVSGEPQTAGHHYRVINNASALSAAGFQTAMATSRGLSRFTRELDDASVLWIWRTPLSRPLTRAMAVARRAGARVVFDIDDLLFRPELARPEVIDGFRHLNFARRAAARRQYRGLERVLAKADHCTAPTEPLAREMRAFGKKATVVPNGFDDAFLRTAQRAVEWRKSLPEDGVIRIGYAAGTLTHQRDLAVALPGIVRALREHRKVKFVCFEGAVDLSEFPELRELSGQLEVRPLVPIAQLPYEYARFDVNIAPLVVDNPFCEAKSELKFFEAALAGVVTVASPTEPLASTIRHGQTGFLAASDESWQEQLSTLVQDIGTRTRIARAAYEDVVLRYGPERRARVLSRLVEELLASPPRAQMS